MKWLEIIHIRTAECQSELLIGELANLLPIIGEEPDELEIALFRHSTLIADLSLHLIHHTDFTPQGKAISVCGFRRP